MSSQLTKEIYDKKETLKKYIIKKYKVTPFTD